MEIMEQTSYNEGATENCKDLIIKANRFLKDLPTEKILKMLRGIEVGFVDVLHEGKRITEDWEDTKLIYAETFYEMLNKYLFDKTDAQSTHFINHTAFVNETMGNPQATVAEIIPFIIKNFLLKENVHGFTYSAHNNVEQNQSNDNQSNSTESDEKIIKVKIDEDGDSIVTYESGRKEIVPKSKQKNLSISNNPTPAVEFSQVDNTVEQSPAMGLVHNHAPNPSVHGNEAIVAAHEADTIQSSNFQNPVNMLKRTMEQNAPTPPVVETEKKYLTHGELFVGVTLTPTGNENLDAVRTSFSEMADFLVELEQGEEIKTDFIFKDLHAHAKNAILTASMSMARLVTYKK